ncbi:hypothetical protein [Aeoliella sp. SH292]|uniref:hypothetical protein n=1 Tax=Aeoliella sp. SH292 TaxID=3454464 RepID=UPI003F9B22A9
MSTRNWLIVIAVFSVIMVPVSYGVRAARTALIAEYHLHAMLQAIVATQSYVEQHHGAWPPTPKDLASHARPGDDMDGVLDHLTYDFKADPAALANESWEEFSGIVPREPCFRAYDNQLMYLIDTLRRYHGGATTP